MGRQHTSAERARAHRQGQRNIRRRCTCGRIIGSNPGWASHLAKAERDGTTDDHKYSGRA